jgi:iron complex transport system substrate-binding protein
VQPCQTDVRVVSLLPSATETVCALGVDPVGVTHECDYPERVRDYPTVVHSRIDTSGASAEIDEAVRAAEGDPRESDAGKSSDRGDSSVDESSGVYDLDRERLAALAPDVVVTQGICDVCAVDESVVRSTVADLDVDAELVATHPHTLSDVFDDIERLGAALDERDRAARLRAELEARVQRVRERAAAAADRPRVLVLDWLDPAMVSGHWVPELVEIAGGDPVLAAPGERSGPVRWDRVRGADPEVLVAAPCGFSLEQTTADVDALTEREGFDSLSAVRENRVYALDGNHYVNRPGPRLVETLEHLAGVIHPELFAEPPADAVRPLDALRERV